MDLVEEDTSDVPVGDTALQPDIKSTVTTRTITMLSPSPATELRKSYANATKGSTSSSTSAVPATPRLRGRSDEEEKHFGGQGVKDSIYDSL